MVTRTLVPGLMLILVLGAQASLPSMVSAWCCPCGGCKAGCTCPGTSPCFSCRGGESDPFQLHALAIRPSSDFSAAPGAVSVLPALSLADLSEELVAITKKGNRRIGDFTSRLLAGAEFRIKSWCPGSLDKSV